MHARHFVSQRFGKSRVTVEFHDEMDSVVTITPCGPDTKTIAFTFNCNRAAQMLGDPQQRPERLMRIAIQQAHKLYVMNGPSSLFGTSGALEVSTAPWIGDLTEARYGGATQGDDTGMKTLLQTATCSAGEKKRQARLPTRPPCKKAGWPYFMV